MFSQTPFDPNKLQDETKNKVAIRISVMQSLDAINLYEELSDMVNSTRVQKFLFSLSDDEKIHLGESLAMLLDFDYKQDKDLDKAREKIKKEMGFEPDI